MIIPIKTDMKKIPEHCGECAFRSGRGYYSLCMFLQGSIHENVKAKTIDPDCPIVGFSDAIIKGHCINCGRGVVRLHGEENLCKQCYETTF